MPMGNFRAVLFVLIGGVSYGLLSTFVKLAYDEGFTPAEVTGSQIVFGVLLLWILALRYMCQLRKMNRKEYGNTVLTGFFFSLVAICYYLSLAYVPASLAIILLFQFTWIGVVIDFLFEGKKPSVFQLLALVFVLFGTYLSANPSEIAGQSIQWQGIALGLGAAVSYSFFIYTSGKSGERVSGFLRSALAMSASALFTLIVYPPEFLVNGSLAAGLWWWGLLIGFFGAFLPTLLFAFGVPVIGPGMSSILGSIELPTVIFMSWTLLGEQVTGGQWLGVGIILLGIVLSDESVWRRRFRTD